MSKKIERLIVAACIGAIGACVLCWVEFYPVLHAEDLSWQGDGQCDVRGCENPSWIHWTETEDSSSPIVEELCEQHADTLVTVP